LLSNLLSFDSSGELGRESEVLNHLVSGDSLGDEYLYAYR
jgi:hypothetical protein